MHKIWASSQTTIDPTSEVSFPDKSGTGSVTQDVADSWGPFSWVRFVSTHTGLVNVRVYQRGNPDFNDDAEFLDDYNAQYITHQLKNGTARDSILTLIGEIWGWNVRSTPTGGLYIYGGTGPVPPV